MWLYGLCGGGSAHELFIAGGEPSVRAYDVRTGRLAPDAFRAPDEEKVNDVAFCVESDTLFVATFLRDLSGLIVRSLSRNNTEGEWTAAHRMQLPLESQQNIYLRVLRDGTLLCGQSGTDGIHMCRLLPDRSMQYCARVRLPKKHVGYDVQLVGDEKRLAAALQESVVALFRVDSELAVKLWSLSLPGASSPMFCGNSLLVGMEMDYKVKSGMLLSLSGDRLQRDRQLIAYNHDLDLWRWCFVEGMIYAIDYYSKNILVYKCIYS